MFSDFFYILRKRKVPVSITEWMTLMEALDKGCITNLDEFYYLADCSLEGKNILLEGPGPDDGKIRPMAWTKRYGQGKVFYTVLGHAEESFKNANFQKLMHQAVLWAVEGR